MSLGKRISTARKRKGLTQAQLAELCDVATITIQQYERDKRQPKGDILQQLSSALGVELSWLVLGITQEEWDVRIQKEVDDYWAEMEEMFLPGDAKRIIAAFSRLNPEGQAKAVERVEELTEIPKYQKKPPQD